MSEDSERILEIAFAAGAGCCEGDELLEKRAHLRGFNGGRDGGAFVGASGKVREVSSHYLPAPHFEKKGHPLEIIHVTGQLMSR